MSSSTLKFLWKFSCDTGISNSLASRPHFTRKNPAPQKDKKQNIDQMIGCALNVAAIDGYSYEDVDQITTFLMGEVDTWCRMKAKKIDPRTGLSELQERMKQKINEVWPFGHCEVHGPRRENLYM